VRSHEEQLKRFLNKIRIIDDHWIFTGYLNKDGYGQTYYKKKQHQAHRFCYEFFVAKIPKGKHIDHKCRVRSCVNPKHLRVVTPRENALFNSESTSAKNFRKTHCNKGHEFNNKNTKFDINGFRICRTCSLQWNKTTRENAKKNNPEKITTYNREWYRKNICKTKEVRKYTRRNEYLNK
jgi:hypothetical protein